MAFVLAHLSDPHIGPLPRPKARELIGKRLTGYVNWRRGRDKAHDMTALAALVADMRARRPDHVAITGDILNIGLPAEFLLAKEWIATLGRPQDVSFVPGNHDAYVRGAVRHIGPTFAPYATGDDGAEGYPYLRRRGPLAIVGLNSAIPRPMFVASGRLGRAQLAQAERWLVEAGAQGLARVVLLHHPPVLAEKRAGRSLIDAADFEAMIGRAGAELVLHGHDHRQAARLIGGPRGGVPVVGVASASLAPVEGRRPGAYHLFTFESDGRDGFHITARARGIVAGKPDDLGAIAFD